MKTKKDKTDKKSITISPKHLKIILFSLCSLLLLSGIIFIITYTKKKHQDETVRVAFYQISKEHQDAIKEQLENLQQEKDYKLVFSEITPENLQKKDYDLISATKKIDLLFTWEGSDSKIILENSKQIPQKIYSQLPTSFRVNKEKYIPVLLDHYEFDFYNPITTTLKLSLPESFSDLQTYLTKSKPYVFSPFFCNGKDDRTFLALYTAVAESLGGTECYNNLVNLLENSVSEGTDLEDIFDKPLGKNGKEEITLKYISNIFKNWQKTGITHPQWFNATMQDVQFFMEDHQVAAVFTSLQQHRNFKYKLISDYTEITTPAENYSANHSVISPAIICIQLSNNMNNKALINHIVSVEAQNNLSQKTMLGPVNSRAECYDKQADDVRFWAASCSGGPVPDIANAVFQNYKSQEKMKKLCSELRIYLQTQ